MIRLAAQMKPMVDEACKAFSANSAKSLAFRHDIKNPHHLAELEELFKEKRAAILEIFDEVVEEVVNFVSEAKLAVKFQPFNDETGEPVYSDKPLRQRVKVRHIPVTDMTAKLIKHTLSDDEIEAVIE